LKENANSNQANNPNNSLNDSKAKHNNILLPPLDRKLLVRIALHIAAGID